MLKVMDIINANDTIPDELFLDTSLLKHMRISHTLKYRRLWTGFDDTFKGIHQFYDIRVRFDSDSAALAFHREYMRKIRNQGPR